MTLRSEIAAHLVAVASLCLAVPTGVAADTGALDATDGGTTDTATADATTGDTATSDTSDAAAMDAADTAPADTTSLDAADAAAPDAGDTGAADAADTAARDVADTGPADAADTSGVDAADTAAPDVADTGAPDVADTGPADVADAQDAVADARDIGPDGADTEVTRARFFGEVEVRSQPDDGSVAIRLERTDGDLSRRQTTEADGDFAFEELPLGTYEVEVSRENYVTIAETFELEGDREARYTLHRDQNVAVRIRALFDHVEEPPAEVSFLLESERGRRTPEGGTIAVQEGVAEWTISELGVGTWELTASAEGFRDVSFRFGATGPNGQPEQLDLRLHMPEANITPPPADTSGCTCRDTGGGGGGGIPQTPGGPIGAPLLILASGLFSWRLLSAFTGRDD